MEETRPCENCGKKMLKRHSGVVYLTTPASYCMEWRCGCGHTVKAETVIQRTEEYIFQRDWEAANA